MTDNTHRTPNPTGQMPRSTTVVHDTTTSSTDRIDETSRSSTMARRGFLAASAMVGAGAFAGAGPVGMAAADEHDDDDGDGMDGTDDGAVEGPEDLVLGDDATTADILNFARLLELLEGRFYQIGLDTLGCPGLLEARALDPFGDEIRGRVFDDIAVIRDHEFTHAEVLGDTVEEVGGDPIPEPEFDFGTAVEDPDEFLALGAELENTGVSAYNGSIADIEEGEIQTAGATVATVEGRHASFLNILNGEIGYPDAFDPTQTREEVFEVASEFIVE